MSIGTMEQVCGLNDPFCMAARTAKYQDSANIMSLNYTNHYRRTLTSLATTNAAGVTLIPIWNYTPTVEAVSIAANVGTWANMVGSPAFTNVVSVRLVTAGIIIRSVAPYMTAAGAVHIRTFSMQNTGSLNSLDIGAFRCTHAFDVALVDCKEVCVILQRTDPIKSKQFVDPTAVLSPSGAGILTQVLPGFEFCCITVDGCPNSTACLDYEVILNWELQFDDTTSTALLMTPSPKLNPAVAAAADSVSSDMKSIFVEGAKAAGSYVLKKAGQALVSAVGARLGVPTSTALVVN